MQERHLVVTRTARYAVLGEAVARPAEVWFVLHGFGQLAGRFLLRFAAFADGRRRIYAPEALNHYYLEPDGAHGPASAVGATWMTRLDRQVEIADYVRYLDTLYRHVFAELDRAATRVLVLGFSQGVATAARWTVLGAARAEQLALWGAPAPPDLDLAAAAGAWRATRLRLVYGRLDRWYDESCALVEAERLRAHGLNPALLGFDGGHELDPATLEAIAAAP